MEMERIRESADDGELVIRRCGLGRPGRRSRYGVPVCRHETAAVVIRDLGVVDVRRIRPALRRPCRYGQVQTVHACTVAHVIDPDPSGGADCRYLAESERQVRVYIDAFRPVSRAKYNLLCRRACRKACQGGHHDGNPNTFHHRESFRGRQVFLPPMQMY